MVQINKDYYEDLTPEIFEQILNDLRDGKEVKPGPQNGRQVSAPEGGPTTLLNGAEKAKRSNGSKSKGPKTKAAAKRGGK